jgi:hypothetical protein
MVDRKYTTRPPKVEVPDDDGAWFAPKRFGYGSGLPIRWEGWAVLGAYLLLLVPLHFLAEMPGAAPRAVTLAIFIAATACLLVITRNKTRGGWRWRWGKHD